MKRTRLLPTAALVAAVVSTAANTSCVDARPSGGEEPGDRPNVLLIITDDQRYDTMEYMPRTQARILDRGVTFSNAYVTTARCGPSRSSVLTGMYAHTHNARVNSDRLREETFVERLHEAGYYTGLVGKYLNSYPLPEDDEPLPEFDSWVAMASYPQHAEYFDTRLNVDGTWIEHEGYQTEILRDYALAFLREAGGRDQPFFLMLSPYTPHWPSTPAPGDEDLYPDLPEYRPPSFNPDDISGKPAWLQALPLLDAKQVAAIDEYRRSHLQSLNALDEAVESLLQELDRQGALDNTLVIYLSDSGLFWGEHRFLLNKIFAYEEAMKIPFVLRYPPLTQEPRVEDRLVANIDIAPTIYELAGIPIPAGVDGLSLVSLLRGEGAWRDHLVLEGWPVDVGYVEEAPPFVAIHTDDYVYIETEGDRSELYDLASDPYQMVNQVDNPDYADVLADLQACLKAEERSIKPPPVTSGASKINRTYHEWERRIPELYRQYRYSKKLWLAIIITLTAVLAFVKRKQVRGLLRRFLKKP